MARRSAIPVDKGKIKGRITVDRAQLRCECGGACALHKGRCSAAEPHAHPDRTGQLVHLELVFLDYNETNWSEANLLGMCQPCRKAHLEAKPKPQALLPEFGGLFGAPVKRRETPTL